MNFAVLCRYMVKVNDKHLTTIQLSTSKNDVRLKLSVLDNEEEVASAEGKGQAVIPVFIFQPNPSPEDETTVCSASQSCKTSGNVVQIITVTFVHEM